MEQVLFAKIDRNPDHYSFGYYLESLGDMILTPAYQVWESSTGRREVSIVNDKITNNEVIHNSTSSGFFKTALCIALFVPSLVLGYIVKSIAYMSSFEIAQDYRKIELQLSSELKTSQETDSEYIKSLLTPIYSHRTEFTLENSVEELFYTTEILAKDLKSFMFEIASDDFELEDCNDLLHAFENSFKRSVFFLNKLRYYALLQNKFYNAQCSDKREPFIWHCFFDVEFSDFQGDSDFLDAFPFFVDNDQLNPFNLLFDTKVDSSEQIPFFKAYSILIHNKVWDGNTSLWTASQVNLNIGDTFEKVEKKFLNRKKYGFERDFARHVYEMKEYLKAKIVRDFSLKGFLKGEDKCDCTLSPDPLLELGF